jgi:hypothetical protein
VFFAGGRIDENVVNLMDDVVETADNICDDAVKYFVGGGHAKRETKISKTAPGGAEDANIRALFVQF